MERWRDDRAVDEMGANSLGRNTAGRSQGDGYSRVDRAAEWNVGKGRWTEGLAEYDLCIVK